MTTCRQCHKQFEITEEDQAYYQKLDVLEPVMCPECRQQHRAAWRNERTLYPNTCALCKKTMVSIYSPEPLAGREHPFTVYCQECWWSDKWDPLMFGMDIDISKSFFEQFKELQARVPRVALSNTNSENSEYTNYTANNKNCYLVFSNSYGHNEDCYYGTCFSKNRNCVDGIQLEDCELSYDSLDCISCFRLVKGQMCMQCSDSTFLEDCRNCSNCFMCKGLRNKEYCILNVQYSKDEYEKKRDAYHLDTFDGFTHAQQEFDEFRKTVPSRYSYQIKTEDCSGDYIFRSNNCHICFDTSDAEDAKFLQYSVSNNKDLYDCSYSGGCELGIENLSYVGGYNCISCNIIWWNVANLFYCELMFNGPQDCFGCIGLRGKKFCILNKQYSEEEYRKLTAEMIATMKQRGEWGHFFPPSLSPFGYNESLAQDYVPLHKEEALRLGFNWNNRTPGTFGKGDMEPKDIPEAIAAIADDILTKKLTCMHCQRNYKLVKQELEFYRTLRIPVPRLCFECRHLARLHKRRPRALWTRQCMCEKADHDHVSRCPVEFETTYAPDRRELVYCEECYQKEVA